MAFFLIHILNAMETNTIHFDYVPLFPCENLKVIVDLQDRFSPEYLLRDFLSNNRNIEKPHTLCKLIIS